MIQFRRLLTGLLLALGVQHAVAANAERAPARQGWIRGIYVAESPVSRPVPADQIWTVAELRAHAVRGTTLQGQGESMLPLYLPGTVLVIAPAQFSELKRGQTVVYYNADGRPVAHVLIAKCRDGWRVAGLNNRSHDDDGVTAENLFGVVVDALHPTPAAALVRLD